MLGQGIGEGLLIPSGDKFKKMLLLNPVFSSDQRAESHCIAGLQPVQDSANPLLQASYKFSPLLSPISLLLHQSYGHSLSAECLAPLPHNPTDMLGGDSRRLSDVIAGLPQGMKLHHPIDLGGSVGPPPRKRGGGLLPPSYGIQLFILQGSSQIFPGPCFRQSFSLGFSEPLQRIVVGSLHVVPSFRTKREAILAGGFTDQGGVTSQDDFITD